MPKFLNNLDLSKNELQNAKLHNIAGADPATSVVEDGLVLFNTTSGLARVSNGVGWDTLTNLLEGVTATLPLVAGAVVGKSQVLSINPASGALPGSMSAANYATLNAATEANTASTLVLRDALNNFAAGTITASLTGTASNAAALNNQAAAYYLARANHSGTQLAATISDFATSVRTNSLSQMAAPAADVSMNTHRLTSLVDPAGAQDAATKNYVDTTNTVITGTAPISAVRAGNTVTVSIPAASASVVGSMSVAHYTAVAGASNTSSANSLVKRDALGGFAAGDITANLKGTADNAALLNSQAAAYYLARANATGTQLAATISNFDTAVRVSRLDQMAVPTVDVSMNAHRLTNILDPVSPQDAATKAYVDASALGLDVKDSVRSASTANVGGTYNPTGGVSGRGQYTAALNALDGVALVAGNRILLKNQTVPAANGIYIVTTVGTGATGVWDRASDFDSDAQVTSGCFVFVEEGTNVATGWVLTTPNPITIGGASGTVITFAQFSGVGVWTAGNGLTLTGHTFAAVGMANRITVAADSIDIASTYAGQASITTLGTISTGSWNATAIPVAKGGTGATTANAARDALNAMGKAVITAGTGIVPDATTIPLGNCAATLGNAVLTSFVVTHDRNDKDVRVLLTEQATGKEVWADVTHTSASTVTVAFAVAPTAAQYRIVIYG